MYGKGKGGGGKGGDYGGKGGKGGDYGGKGDYGKGKGKGGDKGGGGKGGKGGPRWWRCDVEYVAPPKAPETADSFIGAISWAGKDTERGESGDFPNRGKGLVANLGDQLEVVVNASPVNLLEQQRHMYRVDFNPEVELARRRRYLVYEALKDLNQVPLPLACSGTVPPPPPHHTHTGFSLPKVPHSPCMAVAGPKTGHRPTQEFFSQTCPGTLFDQVNSLLLSTAACPKHRLLPAKGRGGGGRGPKRVCVPQKPPQISGPFGRSPPGKPSDVGALGVRPEWTRVSLVQVSGPVYAWHSGPTARSTWAHVRWVCGRPLVSHASRSCRPCAGHGAYSEGLTGTQVCVCEARAGNSFWPGVGRMVCLPSVSFCPCCVRVGWPGESAPADGDWLTSIYDPHPPTRPHAHAHSHPHTHPHAEGWVCEWVCAWLWMGVWAPVMRSAHSNYCSWGHPCGSGKSMVGNVN